MEDVEAFNWGRRLDMYTHLMLISYLVEEELHGVEIDMNAESG